MSQEKLHHLRRSLLHGCRKGSGAGHGKVSVEATVTSTKTPRVRQEIASDAVERLRVPSCQTTGGPLVDAEHGDGGHPGLADKGSPLVGRPGGPDRGPDGLPGVRQGGGLDDGPGGRPGDRPDGPCGPRGSRVLEAVAGYLRSKKSSHGQARRQKRPGGGKKGVFGQTESLLTGKRTRRIEGGAAGRGRACGYSACS